MTTKTDLNATTTVAPVADIPFSTATSIICGTVILLIAISGLIVYMLFILIALGRKKFQRNSYFTMAGWLGIADCICLVLMITYAAPCMLLRRDLSDLKLIGGILNVGWFTGLPLIVFLAANRFLCICHTECYKTLFTYRKTKYYIFLAIVFGFLYSVPSFLRYSPLYFKYQMMSWQWDLDGKEVAKYISIGEITIVMVVTVATHCLNVLVFKKIRALHKSSTSKDMKNRRKCLRERKIFMQFFMTTLWLPVFDIPFIALGYIKNPSPWLGFFTTISYTINCSINGWVYMIVNRTVQYQIKRMILSPKQYLRNSTRDETPSNTDDLSEDARGATMCRDKYSTHADANQLTKLLMIAPESRRVESEHSSKKLKVFA